jgi:hypothetical protein
LGQPINSEVLHEIAATTHGANFSVENFDKVIEQVSALPEPKPIEKRLRLWCDPGWAGFILLLLAGYWVGRKWWGMV